VSSCLSYELSIGTPEADYLVDDASYSTFGTTARPESSEFEEEEKVRQTKEVDSLLRQKFELSSQLSELMESIETRQSQLLELENDFSKRQSVLQGEMEKQEQKRDELEQEVEQMKLRIHLLSSDLKEDAAGQHTFRSILRAFSNECSADSDIEMRTMRCMPTKKDLEHSEHLKRLEQLLDEKVTQFQEMETRYHILLSRDTNEEWTNDNKEPCEKNPSQESQIQSPSIILLDLSSEVSPGRQSSGSDRLQEMNVGCSNRPEARSNRSVIELRGADTLVSEESSVRDARMIPTEIGPSTVILSPVFKSSSTREQDMPPTISNDEAVSDYEQIRSHAHRMLLLAEKAIDLKRSSSSSVCSSVASSEGTDLRPCIGSQTVARHSLAPFINGKPPKIPLKDGAEGGEKQVVITNIEQMDGCKCESSMLSGNVEHAEFYLPRLGVTCTCGRNHKVDMTEGGDPCGLENILRDWQVEFLASVGISDVFSLAHACNNRRGELANMMRQWRTSKKMPSVNVRSCSVALHIWSRTCTSVVKAVREQKAQGIEKPERPGFLDISMTSDIRTVSTLGLGSTFIDTESHGEI
jgi:hypothetical protein